MRHETSRAVHTLVCVNTRSASPEMLFPYPSRRMVHRSAAEPRAQHNARQFLQVNAFTYAYKAAVSARSRANGGDAYGHKLRFGKKISRKRRRRRRRRPQRRGLAPIETSSESGVVSGLAAPQTLELMVIAEHVIETFVRFLSGQRQFAVHSLTSARFICYLRARTRKR